MTALQSSTGMDEARRKLAMASARKKLAAASEAKAQAGAQREQYGITTGPLRPLDPSLNAKFQPGGDAPPIQESLGAIATNMRSLNAQPGWMAVEAGKSLGRTVTGALRTALQTGPVERLAGDPQEGMLRLVGAEATADALRQGKAARDAMVEQGYAAVAPALESNADPALGLADPRAVVSGATDIAGTLAKFAGAAMVPGGPLMLGYLEGAGAANEAARQGAGPGEQIGRGLVTAGVTFAGAKYAGMPGRARSLQGQLVDPTGYLRQFELGAGFTVADLVAQNAVDVAVGKKTMDEAAAEIKSGLPAAVLEGGGFQAVLHGLTTGVQAYRGQEAASRRRGEGGAQVEAPATMRRASQRDAADTSASTTLAGRVDTSTPPSAGREAQSAYSSESALAEVASRLASPEVAPSKASPTLPRPLNVGEGTLRQRARVQEASPEADATSLTSIAASSSRAVAGARQGTAETPADQQRQSAESPSSTTSRTGGQGDGSTKNAVESKIAAQLEAGNEAVDPEGRLYRDRIGYSWANHYTPADRERVIRVEYENAAEQAAPAKPKSEYRRLSDRARELGLSGRGTLDALQRRVEAALRAKDTGIAQEAGPSLDRPAAVGTKGDGLGALGGGEAANPKSPIDRVSGNAKPLSDGSDRNTVLHQLSAKINVPGERRLEFTSGMLRRVLRRGEDREVLRSVVPLLPVDVVNDFIGPKWTPDDFLHNKSMLGAILASPDVPVDVTIRVLDAIGGGALPRATRSLGSGSVGGLEGKPLAAARAGNADATAESTAARGVDTAASLATELPLGPRVAGEGLHGRTAFQTLHENAPNEDVGDYTNPPSTGGRSDTNGDIERRTSARKAMTEDDRKAMGLETLPSPDRHSWENALADAREAKIPERAMRLAQEVNEKPRSLSDTETAGMVLHATTLKNEHAKAMDAIGKATDPAEIAAKSAEAARIEQDFDSLTTALRLSGTEKGRALASQKLTINQDYQLVSVKNRAKAAKGKELSPAEAERFERMTKELEDVNKRVIELERQMKEQMAERAIRKARNPANRMAKAIELEELYAKAQALIKAGCN